MVAAAGGGAGGSVVGDRSSARMAGVGSGGAGRAGGGGAADRLRVAGSVRGGRHPGTTGGSAGEGLWWAWSAVTGTGR